MSGLTIDSSGNLYGTTYSDGADSRGTVFEVAHGSNTITTIASFNFTNGANPESGLTIDSLGNLYGSTSQGAANNNGTVFEIAKGSGTLTTLASFNYNTTGAGAGSLVLDSAGDLFSTTDGGGPGGNGTVFEIAKGSGTISTLFSFNTGINGTLSGLLVDGSGNLYGSIESVYPGAGSVFEITGRPPWRCPSRPRWWRRPWAWRWSGWQPGLGGGRPGRPRRPETGPTRSPGPPRPVVAGIRARGSAPRG